MTRMGKNQEKEAECIDSTFPGEMEEGVNDRNEKKIKKPLSFFFYINAY